MSGFLVITLAPIICAIMSYSLPKLRNEFSFIGALLPLYFSLLIFKSPHRPIPEWGNVFSSSGFYFDYLTGLMLIVLSFAIFVIVTYSFRYTKGMEHVGEYYLYTLFLLGFGNILLLLNNLLLIGGLWLFVSLIGLILSTTISKTWIKRPKRYFILLYDLFFIGGVLLTKNTPVLMDNYSKLLSSSSSIIFYLGSIMLFVGIIGKLGLFPFHNWLDDLSAQTFPLGHLVFVTAIQRIIGIYLLIRLGYFIFDDSSFLYLQTLVVLASVINILWTGYRAIHEDNIYRFLIENEQVQLSLVIIGIFSFTPTVFAGGLLLFIFNLIVQLCLIQGVGSVQYWRKTFDLIEVAGLVRKLPITCLIIILAMFLNIGFLPLAGFYGKWFMLQGLFPIIRFINSISVFGVIIGTILVTIYSLKFLKIISFPPAVSLGISRIREVGFTMWFTPFLVGLLGIILSFFLEKITLPQVILPILQEVFTSTELISISRYSSVRIWAVVIIGAILLGGILQEGKINYKRIILRNKLC
jgi:formate hydrogenlyase subunit 3/multisubunit Na+/H+ antiporter MnhD subunit